MGLTNVEIMVPFVRTARAKAAGVVELLAEQRPEARRATGSRHHHDVRAADATPCWPTQFLEYFDGMSIGSNDLTQLTLGLDRDSGIDCWRATSTSATRPSRPCLARHRGLPRHRQVHRHLRPGPVRPSRPRRLAGRSGHRQHLAQPGHGGRDLAAPGGAPADRLIRADPEAARVRAARPSRPGQAA